MPTRTAPTPACRYTQDRAPRAVRSRSRPAGRGRVGGERLARLADGRANEPRGLGMRHARRAARPRAPASLRSSRAAPRSSTADGTKERARARRARAAARRRTHDPTSIVAEDGRARAGRRGPAPRTDAASATKYWRTTDQPDGPRNTASGIGAAQATGTCASALFRFHLAIGASKQSSARRAKRRCASPPAGAHPSASTAARRSARAVERAGVRSSSAARLGASPGAAKVPAGAVVGARRVRTRAGQEKGRGPLYRRASAEGECERAGREPGAATRGRPAAAAPRPACPRPEVPLRTSRCRYPP